MSKKKKIVWESWNAKVSSYVDNTTIEEEEDTYNVSQLDGLNFDKDIFYTHPRVMYTPIGPYPEDSLLKPSDRWDCWTAHTNFPITGKILNILNEEIDGIEVLKITGKYSFFIGVAKLFDIADVRRQIDEKICSYTEKEILSDNDVEKTVYLLKDQLKDNKHWSILVYPEGMVEYIVANEMNIDYLDGLSNLIEKKNSFGGIILRSDHG